MNNKEKYKEMLHKGCEYREEAELQRIYLAGAARCARLWEFALYEVNKGKLWQILAVNDTPSDFGLELARYDTFYSLEKELIRLGKKAVSEGRLDFNYVIFKENKKTGDVKFIERIYFDKATCQLVLD